MSFGDWIRDRLLEVGDKGVTVADLHKLRRETRQGLMQEGGPIYRNGTYNSFARYFHWFKQLKFVESVRVEPSEAKGNGFSLEQDRHYYRISDQGRRATELQWQDPISTLHPEWTPYARYKKYQKPYVPTGKPRGRPPKISW